MLEEEWKFPCMEPFAQVKMEPHVMLFFTEQLPSFWIHDKVNVADQDIFFRRTLDEVALDDNWNRVEHYASIRGVILPHDLRSQVQALMIELS
jgi:hypothetical protein